MSTLKVAAIKNESSSANNIVLNADGTVSMSATTISAASVTATGTVSGATVTSSGDVNDSVSDVRTPRRTAISTATTIADEGVYYCTSNPTLTLGAPAAGAVMTIYNNSASSMTLNRGSTVTNMRIAADNTTTNKTSVTLGAYSTTVVTMFNSTFAVVSGSDVS